MKSMFLLINSLVATAIFSTNFAYAQRPTATIVPQGGPPGGYQIQTHGFPGRYRITNLFYTIRIIVLVTDEKNRPVANLIKDGSGREYSIEPFTISSAIPHDDCRFIPGTADNLADNEVSIPGGYAFYGLFQHVDTGTNCSWNVYSDYIYVVQIRHKYGLRTDIAGSALGYAPRYVENGYVEP